MATNRQIQEGEAELTRLLRWVARRAGGSESEAMYRTDLIRPRAQARTQRAQAVLRGARALEARARSRMGIDPNGALRDLNRALAMQERAQAVLGRWRDFL